MIVPKPGRAQVPDPVVAAQAPQPGSEHSYIGVGAESVNPADGQVTFDLPIQTPPGRQLSFPFGTRYNHAEYYYLTNQNLGQFNWQYRDIPNNVGGWSYDLPYLTGQVFAQDLWTTYSGYPLQADQHQCDAANNFVFRGFDGRQYTLMLAGGIWNDANYKAQNPNDCLDSPYDTAPTSNTHGILATYPSSYSGWPLIPPITVVDQSGTTYQFTTWGGPGYSPITPGSPSSVLSLAQTITDRNGDRISLNGNSYNDTLGRQVVSWTGLGNNGDRISVSGLSQNIVLHWAPTPGGSYPMSGYMLSGTANCTVTTTGPPGGDPAISEIDLPNGQYYKFSYDSTYGTVSEIQFPDGGSVRYAWGLSHSAGATYGQWWFSSNGYQAPESCAVAYDVPAVTDRWVNDGTKDVLHQQFSYSTNWTSSSTPWKQTTVRTTDLQAGETSVAEYTYEPLWPDLPPYAQYSPFGTVPVETTVVYQDGSGNTLRTLNQQWGNVYSLYGSQTVLDNGQTMTTLRCYDPNEQMTQFYEYGFPSEGSYPGDPSCASSSGLPATKGPLERQTTIVYQGFSSSTHIVNAPECIAVSGAPMVISSQCTVVSGTPAKKTNFYYTDSVTSSGAPNLVSVSTDRGNISSVQRWLNTTNSYLSTGYTYFDTGQVASMTDPNGNQTSYCYGDTSPGCPSGNTFGYLTQVTYPSTNGVSHIEEFSWYLPTESYLPTGKLASSIDENGQTTSYTYNDPLARLTQITYPITPGASYNGSSCSSPGETTYFYDDVPGSVSVTTSKLLCNGVPPATSTAYLNGLGLTTKTIGENSAETDTTYDGFRRVYEVSNPYFSASDPTYGLTTTLYDPLGRVKSVTKPDNSVVNTSYSGACATVTDEHGNTRTPCTDGLGRLSQVTEGGLGYVTTYQHDTNNNLTGVTQGVQTRSFPYDSLSRLTSATNPESGLTSYTYPTTSGSGMCSGDPSSPCTRTDARGITTTYAYDALNRLTSKTYSDGATPTATFSYDEPAVTLGSWTSPGLNNPNGRLTHTATTSGGTILTATVQDYDATGRTKDYWQCTPLNCGSSTIWAALYNYDLAGDVTSWNHPAGFTITQTISGAQQISQVTSSVSDSADPASLATITYTPFGSVQTLLNGCVGSGCTSLQESYFYNTRLQPAVIELGTSTSHAANSCRVYNYYVGVANASACSESLSAWPTGNNNDRDVAGYYYVDNISTGLNHSAVYTYDAVNRLSRAGATGNSTYMQTFGYDAYGNMTCSANPAEAKCLAPTYGATNNRMGGYRYDSAGDVTNDGTYTYQWDAEAYLTAVIGGSGQTVSANTYNALGQTASVFDANQTPTTHEAYGPGGELLWRYNAASNMRSFVPFQGRIVAEYYYPGSGGVNPEIVGPMTTSPSGTLFDHSDGLGSITTSTTYAGGPCQERLFYPFGESWTGAGSCGMHQTFAQLPDYDAETDQYNTLNRHYTPMGRWMSPDPAGGHLEDPQTLNKYAYARNNPTTFTDPTGLDFYQQCQQTKDNTQTCNTVKGYGNLTFYGTTDQNGQFHGTVTTSASLQDPNSGNTAVVNANGVQLTTANGTSEGVFISGTPAAKNIQGDASKGFGGFTFDINGNCGGTCLSSGSFQFTGTPQEARDALLSAGAWNYGFWDMLNSTPLGHHPETDQFRFGSGPSLHVSVPWDFLGIIDMQLVPNPASTVPATGGWHADETIGYTHFKHANIPGAQ